MTDYLPFSESTLDRCLDAIYDHGKSAADCLAQNPAERETLEPVLRLAERLQAGKRLTASHDFHLAASARMEQMLAAAPQMTTAVPLRPSSADIFAAGRRATALNGTSKSVNGTHGRTNGRAHTAGQPASPRRPLVRAARPTWALTVGLLVVVILLMVNTTVSLANRALPGSTFFPVKIAAESVQLALAPSDAQDADLHLKFADLRFQEVQRLMLSAQTDHLDDGLQRYQNEIDSAYTYTGASLLTDAQKAQISAQLAGLLERHAAGFNQVVSQAGASAPLQIVTAARQAVARIQRMYAALRQGNPNLPSPADIFAPFPSLATAAPTIDQRTATPSPRPTLTALAAQPTPGSGAGAAHPQATEWESEWPTAWPSPWPTQWATMLATLVPTGHYTELPPALQTVIATAWPTFLPTGQPQDWPTPSQSDGPPPGWGTDMPTGIPPEMQQVLTDLPALPTAMPNWPDTGPSGPPPDLPTGGDWFSFP